jgi:hypothetical protein
MEVTGLATGDHVCMTLHVCSDGDSPSERWTAVHMSLRLQYSVHVCRADGRRENVRGRFRVMVLC